MPRDAGSEAEPARGRTAFAVFLLIWLAVLTGGVILVGGAFLSGPDAGAGLMLLWLSIAGAGWGVGAWLLARMAAGRRRRRRRAAP